MAEVKNKVVTVESLKTKHDYDESTYFKKSGGTVTNNVTVQKSSTPNITLSIKDTSAEAKFYKSTNAATSVDNGTTISDCAFDGTRDSLVLSRNATLEKKLHMIVNHGGDNVTDYMIYGEHHKPTPTEIGALSTSGGTMTGDITLSGGGDIVVSNKDFYFSHSSGDTSHRSVLLGGDSYDNGASIYLNGKDYSSDKGRFLLRAANGTKSVNLIGMPDGTLTWNGNNVVTSASVTPCCTFSGEDSTQTLTAGDIITAKLTTFSVNTAPEHFSATSDFGVKVLKSGYYQISASAYITCATTSGVRTVHIYKNTEELIMVRSDEGKNYASQGGIATAPKVVYINANDIIYLKVRAFISDGDLVANSGSTYLSIVKM